MKLQEVAALQIDYIFWNTLGLIFINSFDHGNSQQVTCD